MSPRRRQRVVYSAVVVVVFCWSVGVVCIPDRRHTLDQPKQPSGINDDVAENDERQRKKEQSTRDLFDGRTALADAVELCLTLDDDYPHLATTYRPYIDKLPGESYAEKTARHLLALAEIYVSLHPDNSTLMPRLHAEFTALY